MTDRAPPPDRQALWNTFQKIDKDRNGSINSNELQQALSNGTWTPFNPETIRLMMGMFDRDGSRSLSFEEFASLYQFVLDWQRCFSRFDRDNSGSIDKRELREALTSFGYRLSDNFIDVLIRKFDRQGKGGVAFDDFIQACVTLQTLTNAFRKYDHQQNGTITLKYEDFLTMVLELNR